MKCLSFVAIIGCFLNVSLTWSLSVMNEIPSQVAFARNQQVTLNSSAAEKICYDKFTPRVNYLMEEIKNSTNIYVNGADLKAQISEKVKLIRDLSAKCALELNPRKYFTCMKSIAADNKKLLKEIVLITENFSKQNKTECLIEIFERAKYKSSSAIYDLNLCLQNIHQPSVLLATTPEPIDYSSEVEDVYDDDVNNIKTKYKALKECVQEDWDFKYCWEQVGEIDAYGPSFEKFAAYDKAENSCIRQFIFIYYKFEHFEFDLDGCLRNGRASMMQSEENEEMDIQLIRNLLKYYKSFNACRVISKDLNTDSCNNELLTNNFPLEIQKEFFIKSQENFKKIKDITIDLYIKDLPCIKDMLRLFQFDSMDMYSTTRSDLKDCLMLGNEIPSTRGSKEILNVFQEIQDNIKSCTLHANSPGLEQCLYNYRAVYADFHTKLVHPEIVDESDRTEHTCFRFILKDYFKENDYEELRNCLFKKS